MERLLRYFVPEEYTLEILVDKSEKVLGGLVMVRGEVLSHEVKFHASGLEIFEVVVGADKKAFTYDGETLVVSGMTPGDVVEISIWYRGSLRENMEGAYLSSYANGKETELVVATQFESHHAREAFPCIDEPAAKAVFNLTLTVPEERGMKVLSNTPQSSVKKLDKSDKITDYASVIFSKNTVKKLDKCERHVFLPTPKMSTYLVAFVIGKFHSKTLTNRDGVEITTYAALNQDIDSVDFANEVAARSLEFYNDNFGIAYPLKKLDQVALPDFESGAMENWGLVTYRESMLLVGAKATLGAKKTVALTVAHELAHQWFGNLVTMEWWDDLWLNESFASVMEYYAVDNIFPEYRIFEGFYTGDCLAALHRDAYSRVQAVHQEVDNPAEIETLFDPAIVYAKGARLMLMVVRAMGWTEFTSGLRDYFLRHRFGNTHGDDLWAALRPYAKFDVGKVMHAFIDQPGYPVLENTGVDFDRFRQRRFLLDGALKESSWELPEISEDMSGHYILNLSDEEFAARLDKFDRLGSEEKLRLLIDRNLVTKTELASSASLPGLIFRFRHEESAAVWSAVSAIVSGLKIFFVPGSEREKRYKGFVSELVSAQLAKVGLKTRVGDDENTIKLRAILVALALFAEDAGVIRTLDKMYREDFLAIDEEMRSAILEAHAYLWPEVVDEYIEAYGKIADPEMREDLLYAGTRTKDPVALDKMMKLLDKPEVVKPQDQFYLFLYLFRTPELKDRVFDWLMRRWDYVRGMVGSMSLDNYPRYMASAIMDSEDLVKYEEFFRPMRNDPILKRAIEVGENEIRARLKLIEADGDAIYEELARIGV